MTPTLFEGPEKKLELAVVDGHPPLRGLGDSFWQSVVEVAGARVLSRRSNDYFDAYLLSESSLFVYDNFVTMITCGQTELVNSVRRILDEVEKSAIAVCFYERKHEHFPHAQPSSFYEDARVLREQLDGRALRFGAEHEHAVYLFHTERAHVPDPDDVTIEVLMHGIDERRAALFREGPSASDSLADALNLHALVPGAELDEHRFHPVGVLAQRNARPVLSHSPRDA